jgi:heme-degrading monooxygenase HmoA
MYACLFTAYVQPDKLEEFPHQFSEMLLPTISQERGFKSIYLMLDPQQNKVVVLVLWEAEADAIASIDHYLHERLPKMANFLVREPLAETLEVVLRA